jgi:hypothetical protein
MDFMNRNKLKKDNKSSTAPADTQNKKEEPAITPEEPVVEAPVKRVPKKVLCTRCGGDGVWHTSATGPRALTSSEPAIDTNRVCPKCKGSKMITIMISEGQAEADRVAKNARTRADKAATQARLAAEAAEKAAQQAEEKVAKFSD